MSGQLALQDKLPDPPFAQQVAMRLPIYALIPGSPTPLLEVPNYQSIKRTSDKRLADEEAERLRLEALRTDCEAQGGTLTGETCEVPPPAPAPTYSVSVSVSGQVYSLGGLTGSYGYSVPWGNCVNEPGVNNPGWGNPIAWPATSYEPWIGASALFYFNHVGVVTGIWSNGDLEIRHQNWGGVSQSRFPRSMFRGFR